MTADVCGRRTPHRLAELPCFAWLVLHTLLYLGLALTGYLLWGLGHGHALTATVAGAVWLSPMMLLAGVAAGCCLGVLRLLSDARWYWFRLAAVLLFAAPFPLYVLATSGSVTALPVAAVQLVAALLIIQPREGPAGWADRDPTPTDHR